MSHAAALPAASTLPAAWTRTLARYSIALAAFLGAFVIREPAPYELYLVGLMGVFVLFGLRLSVHALTLAVLFVAFNAGGLLSMMQMGDLHETPMYIAVSLFLGLSSVFFCAVVEADAGRLRTIMRAYVLGAAVCAATGSLAYFGVIPGASTFTRYDRAMGFFQDPNVFGPFLVLPALYLLYGLLYRSWTLAPLRGALLLVLAAGIFLSFSRAAWGLLLISGGLFYLTLLVSEARPAMRLRLLLMGGLAFAFAALALIVALQFDAVYSMFETRAQVVQEYDGARLGRFARHAIGFEWALSHPLGIGPLEFGRRLGEDTHNIWVKALMGYGWLGFAAWLAMTVLTLVAAGRNLLLDRPWRPYLQALYAAFVGHIVIAWVIDVDHWRHVYLIIGLLWGCIALEAAHGRYATNRGP